MNATAPDARHPRSDAVAVFGVMLALAALFVGVVGVGIGWRAIDDAKARPAGAASQLSGNAAPSSVMVHLSEFKVEPSSIEVAAGGALQVMNGGTTAHNLAVEGKGLATPMLAAGGSETLSLAGLEPGEYTVVCEVPGHKQSGMKAALRVVKDRATKAAAAGSTTHADMDATMAARTKAFPAKTDGAGGQLLEPQVLADGTKQFDLTTKVVQWETEPGKTVEAWTYNGTVPGPTIKVNPGDKVRVVLHNELPESTVIHFHGLDLPFALDGVPDISQPPVKPGTDYTYEFIAQPYPAVGMYHSHHDATKQVGNGLAGAFLIGELPAPAGVQVTQEQTMMLNDTGTIGFTLNGKSFPATAPVVAKLGEWVEMHYLNEGVMAHPMHLHGLVQLVTAKDGFPLPQPYRADTVTVGPGERLTVLVHADKPGIWAWHCHILPHAEREDGMFGMVTAMIVK